MESPGNQPVPPVIRSVRAGSPLCRDRPKLVKCKAIKAISQRFTTGSCSHVREVAPFGQPNCPGNGVPAAVFSCDEPTPVRYGVTVVWIAALISFNVKPNYFKSKIVLNHDQVIAWLLEIINHLPFP